MSFPVKKAAGKHAASPFDICPKHKGFFKSCGCPWEKKHREAPESTVEPIEPSTLDL